MATLLSCAVIGLLLAVSFGVGWVFDLRTRWRQQDSELRKLSGVLEHLAGQVHMLTLRRTATVTPVGALERTAVAPVGPTSPFRTRHPADDEGDGPAPGELPRATLLDMPDELPATPVVYADDMDIPAELVGARCKEAIERFAPVLGVTPVNLLRAALSAGLTGDRPVTTEMLDMLDSMLHAGDLAPPLKPGSSGSN